MDWIGKLFSFIGIDIPGSPRDRLREEVLKLIVTPIDPHKVVQQAYSYTPYFLWFAVALFVIEVPVRLIMAAVSDKTSGHAEMREILISSLWLFGFVGIAPGFIASTVVFINMVGRALLAGFMGNGKWSTLNKNLGELTGFAPVDFLLSAIQIASFLMIALGLVIMIAALAMSTIILILGMMLRWIKNFGDNALRTSIMITLWSIIINAVLMIVLGGTNAVARGIFPDNQFWRGIMNTGAFFLSGWIIWRAITGMSDRVKMLASSAVSGARRLRGHERSSNTSVDPDGGKKQARAAEAVHQRHAEAMSEGSGTGTASTGSTPSSSQWQATTKQHTAKDDSNSEDASTSSPEETPGPERRRSMSSTAARSTRNPPRRSKSASEHQSTMETDRQPVPQSSSTAVQEVPRRQHRGDPPEENRRQQQPAKSTTQHQTATSPPERRE